MATGRSHVSVEARPRLKHLLMAGLLGFLPSPAMAQQAAPPVERAFSNPPRLLSRQENPNGAASSHAMPMGMAPMMAPMTAPMGGAAPMAHDAAPPQASPPAPLPSSLEKVDFDLDVRYVDGQIFNPTTHRDDKVHLRSYAPHTGDAARDTVAGASLVAPTIEVYPGQTVDVTLHNRLPVDPYCTWHDQPTNTPHCFNGTNLHAHGLWVSPTGNSDNVLLSINPQVDFQYVYNIPTDHPAGTFWYHSHRHGSTALQVSSGMAGALIVRGERPPTPSRNGDIDTLLQVSDPADPKKLKPMKEQILVFQQIQYACLYKENPQKGQVKVEMKRKDGKDVVVAWICDPDDVGVVESYEYPGDQGFGPGSWGQSARFTTINGRVRPALEAVAGVPQRWRMIHGGVRDTITVGFIPFVPQAAPNGAAPRSLSEVEDLVRNIPARDGAQFIRDNCRGELLTYQQIASDGLTMSQALPQTQATLQPGYRVDALVTFPKAGQYCMVNLQNPAAGSVSRTDTEQQILGVVDVKESATPQKPLLDQLLEAANRMPIEDPKVRAAVIADLNAGLRFDRFTPHQDVTDRELTGKQSLVFYINIPESGNQGSLGFDVGDVSITDPSKVDLAALNLRPYDPNRVDRALKLGGADEWTLQSAFVGHPFHIHVNPFQIVKILDPWGRDVSKIDVPDDGGKDHKIPLDTQYRGLSGVWKDTLWVKNLITDPAKVKSDLKDSMYTITIRTRYERYIGEFVLHCHILDHEDQGMMQNVSIQIPDGVGGVAAAHH